MIIIFKCLCVIKNKQKYNVSNCILPKLRNYHCNTNIGKYIYIINIYFFKNK